MARNPLATAAARIGISPLEYQDHMNRGDLWCSRCLAWHPADQFSRDRSTVRGRASACRASVNAARRRRAQPRRAKVRETVPQALAAVISSTVTNVDPKAHPEDDLWAEDAADVVLAVVHAFATGGETSRAALTQRLTAAVTGVLMQGHDPAVPDAVARRVLLFLRDCAQEAPPEPGVALSETDTGRQFDLIRSRIALGMTAGPSESDRAVMNGAAPNDVAFLLGQVAALADAEIDRLADESGVSAIVTAPGGGVRMDVVPHPRLLRSMVGALIGALNEAKATNYLVMNYLDLAGRPAGTVTIQRPGHPTPHQKRVTAETAFRSLRAAVAALTLDTNGSVPVSALRDVLAVHPRLEDPHAHD